MKRCAILPVVILLVLLLFSSAAIAADNNINGATGTLSIPAGSHTLTGTASGLSIECAAGVSLTLSGASVISTEIALSFTGTGNEIILAAGTASSFTSGTGKAGISVPVGAVLTIRGSGELTSDGGRDGAGIGGNYLSGTGTINIAGGTIYANGGSNGAAIGSGALSDNGTVNISGGTITAIGGSSGAGIGGGAEGSGGNINISGGTVNAIGSTSAAGIGGGIYGNGGAVHITGGTVTATGGYYAAGIGGGGSGGCGNVTIAGGKVYASYGRGVINAMDIGKGNNGDNNGTLTLEDGAAVFLEHDSYISPTILGTQTHYNPVPFVGNTANGITVPASWTSAQGAFLPPAPAAGVSTAPQTGDDNRVVLWLLMTGIAGSAIVLILKAKRRQAA